MFLSANVVDDATKKQAIFLSYIGDKSYKLLRSLADNMPSERPYDNFKTLLTENLNIKANIIAERYKFSKRDR